MANLTPNHDSFSHTPLERPDSQIRLRELLPTVRQPPGTTTNHFDQPIYCKLQTVSLSSQPAYKALSYAWGPEDQERSDIYIKEAALSITISLDVALKHLRHKQETSLLIWIDQICIMQQNYPERDAQVRIMARIYSGAEQVLVWLGAAGQDSDDLMDSTSASVPLWTPPAS